MVSNSTISGSTSGINNIGSLTVINSTISGNSAFDNGGGILSEGGSVTVTNSTIADNSAFRGGGGIYNRRGVLTVRNSTISGNSAREGGGIANYDMLTVTNSTISGNTVRPGVDPVGGGIYNAGMLTVENSTISANSAETGGGVRAGVMSARNTIIAGNTAPSGPDVSGNLGSGGYNLIGNPQDMSGWVETDLLHVNPLLGPLQDNGGSTRTHALLANSPAINAGDPTFQPPPDTDQRGTGFSRVINGRIDIGAFEVQPAVAYFYLYPDTSTVAPGVPFDLYVLALDAMFNILPDYTGEVAFFSTDPNAMLPAPYTFRPSDQGIAAFPAGVTLNTAGVQVLFALDTATYTAFGYAVYTVSGGGSPGGGSGPGGGGSRRDGDAAEHLATPSHSVSFNVTVEAKRTPTPPRTLPVDSHPVSMGREVLPSPTTRRIPRTDSWAIDGDVFDHVFAA